MTLAEAIRVTKNPEKYSVSELVRAKQLLEAELRKKSSKSSASAPGQSVESAQLYSLKE